MIVVSVQELEAFCVDLVGDVGVAFGDGGADPGTPAAAFAAAAGVIGVLGFRGEFRDYFVEFSDVGA